MITDSQIDGTIVRFLVTTNSRWRKVAMVIATAADALSDELPDGDAGYDLIAQRIETLVKNGRLIAQGNISKWRYSDVRYNYDAVA